MTNSAILKHDEEAISSDEQQMDAAMSEKIARLLESPDKDSQKPQQVQDTVNSRQLSHLSIDKHDSLMQSVASTLSDTSPSTPPAGKPSLNLPPPDTPTPDGTSAPGSGSAAHNSPDDITAASKDGQKPSAGASALHAGAASFVPNIHAPAFIPSSGPKLSHVSAHVTNGHAMNGFANGYANGYSPHAQGESSPHGGWDESAFSDASGYQNGWAGAYDGYNGYTDAYAGYTYGGMTPDGLFIPQQADASWRGMGESQGRRRGQAAGYPNSPAGRAFGGGETDAALAVLQEQFPLYNQDSLTDVLKVNAYDLVGALDMLAQLESEQTGQRKQFIQAPPSLDEDNFPSLAMSPAPSPRAAAKGPALASGQAPTDSPRAAARSPAQTNGEAPANSPRQNSQGLPELSFGNQPSAWGSSDSKAHKAISPEKKSKAWGDSQADSASSQQKALASNSKLQAGAASFKTKKKGASVVPWVETGAVVSGQYADAREEARDHARLRNMYFQQATQAYLIGNKALAKELGAKGRHHSDQMKAAHAAASETIFQQRNLRTASSAFSNRNGAIMLDLHGLHVSEAIKILSRELGQLKGGAQGKGRAPVRVHVLVGTGHHTKGSRTPARLPVAVETYLQGEGLKYTRPEPGLLQMTV